MILAGEPGTGRSTLAQALHDLSARRGAALVRLTAADAEESFAARMAEARGGTLLIEDPAGWAAAAQSRLAGLIEAGAGADRAPRLLATTGPAPEEDAASGTLRPDLYYRLAGMTLMVPPLRARLDDLPALVPLLLGRAGHGGVTLSDEALAALRAHPFPGNLRELDNILRRLALTAATTTIQAAEVAAALDGAPVRRTTPPAAAGRLSDSVEQHLQRYFDLHGHDLPPPGLYDRVLNEIERPLIQIALDACGGNQLRCAELLGINRNTLRKKVNDLNIEVTRRRRVM